MYKKFFPLILIVGFLLLFPMASKADGHCSGGSACASLSQAACNSAASQGCSWVQQYGSGNCASGQVCLQNPLGQNTNSVQVLIGKVITAVMGVIGSIALLMFIYGGITWMTSSGNDEKVKKGRGIIVWAAIGLVVIFLSYALTRFVLTTIAS